MAASTRRRGIVLLTGPMFAGKTRELIARLQSERSHGEEVLALNHALVHTSNSLVSRAGTRFPGTAVNSALEADAVIRECRPTVIGLDELHFFDGPVTDVLLNASRSGLVVAAGLDLDFRGIPFPTTSALTGVADEVVRLSARCAICGRPASLSQRLTAGKPASWLEETIDVGSATSYEPRCPTCHVVVDRPDHRACCRST